MMNRVEMNEEMMEQVNGASWFDDTCEYIWDKTQKAGEAIKPYWPIVTSIWKMFS